MDLIQYIESKIKLSTEECEAINAAFKKEGYPKGTNLVQPDNRSHKIYFVEEGLIRLFYINQEGKDITHFFFGENNFTMSVENVYFNNPDPYGREVLEDSTLRIIHFREFTDLLDKVSAFKSFSFLVAIDMLKRFSDRLFSLQFQTAEQRYKIFIDNYPNILLRAPLGDIASYLGITQQTLSVIRSKK
ncbi:Crp/Fnr family transcriptional regulator [Mucilaginibacter aquaedulcis]|uniref:Crp/Fnr family transcriptional regulator n=1 Tax=Mucilaginibacter aquaedulcis TaxID=1187081 RepID=UPI0025B58952|nr:Crp/Fnr family transcriptional regulator [Mucilaginibacter aquaedulcis]MDN3550050.1 Crp/Fnr family transcriptional regulator [Mucilaginibacter aquaedulcis]